MLLKHYRSGGHDNGWHPSGIVPFDPDVTILDVFTLHSRPRHAIGGFLGVFTFRTVFGPGIVECGPENFLGMGGQVQTDPVWQIVD